MRSCEKCRFDKCKWRSVYMVSCLGFEEKVVGIPKWIATNRQSLEKLKASQKLKPKGKSMKELDISNEKSRIYTYLYFGQPETLVKIVIESPKKLYLYGKGHAFHRVFNGETVNLCHAPGPIRAGDHNIVGHCFLSWVPKQGDAAVAF